MVHPSTSQPLKAVKLSLALIYLQQTSGYGDGVSRRGLKYLLTDLLPACHLLRPPSTTSILARTLHPPEALFIGQKRENSKKERVYILCRAGFAIFSESGTPNFWRISLRICSSFRLLCRCCFGPT